MQLRAIESLQRELLDIRARLAAAEGQTESLRSQNQELDIARMEQHHETQAVLSRALKAEEQVASLLRQVEDLGSQLHMRALEEETKAAGSWNRYVAVVTGDRDRAIEDSRVARRRADELEAENRALRDRVRRAEDTVDYLRSGHRARTADAYVSSSPPPASRAQRVVEEVSHRVGSVSPGRGRYPGDIAAAAGAALPPRERGSARADPVPHPSSRRRWHLERARRRGQVCPQAGGPGL